MKNKGMIALLVVCFLFIGLLLGFFLGRNIGHEPIYISKLPAATEPTVASAAETEKKQTLRIMHRAMRAEIVFFISFCPF